MQENKKTKTSTSIALSALNTSVRVQGQNFSSDEERQAAQALFLAYLAETGVLIQSCKLSHVSFPTYQAFLEEPDFAEGCQIALQEYKESVFAEVDRRGKKGYLEPLVKNGSLILDAQGKPISVRKYSDRLLELLFHRFYKPDSHSGLTLTGGSDANTDNSDLYVHLPWDEMLPEEQALVEAIGRNIDARALQKGTSNKNGQ